MARWRSRIGWTLLGLLFATLAALLLWEPFAALQPGPPPPKRDYAATITRDEFGVPHAHGRTDADVAFGIAWAHAEDDFATLQDAMAITRGRHGAIAGQSGAGTDFALHLLDVRGTVERRYRDLPVDVRALLDAYASGLNLYAVRHRGEVKLARLFPVSGRDIAAGFVLRQPFFFGLDQVIAPLADGELPYDMRPRARSQARADSDLNGSNAFAIAPSRSPDGATHLVSNTHQPWRGPTAWYELVIESDEGWHFAGATFPGAPFPLLGHNETLGWTNTVNRPDLTDIYRLTLDEDRTRYRLDGCWLPLERRRVLLPVRWGPFVLPVIKSVWRTRHGPTLLNERGGFAIRYAGMGRLDQITQYYRLTKARNFTEWRAIMAMQAIPSTNFVYADRAGNIAFIYNALLPAREPGPNWRGIVPGDQSSLIWPGSAPWSAVPRIVNPPSGYLFNANNTPFLAAGPGGELDPGEFAPELGIELGVTNRARRAARLLARTDSIGYRELLAIKYDTQYERAGYVEWMLDRIAALDLRDEPELAQAQALLGRWDLRADGRGSGDALGVMVLQPAMQASNGRKPAPEPRRELAAAVAHLKKHFGRIDPPLGEVLRLRHGRGSRQIDLPLHGGPDTLRAMTNWDVADDGRLLVKHGDSFIMFVEWPRNGRVRSRSIQPFGQAMGRPRSPHFADQAPLFVAHRTKPVHFTRDEIAAHAVRQYVVSNR